MHTRRLDLVRKNGHWTINGHTWDDIVASKFTKVLGEARLKGDVEIWELGNKSGGWFHPVHIHLIDFKVLDRNGKPPMPHELGPKDVVYVGENETVRVIMRFEGLRQVHDPLPQPRPRGPRHDDPVRGRRSGHARRRPARLAAQGRLAGAGRPAVSSTPAGGATAATGPRPA